MISIGIGLWGSGLTLAQRIAALFAAGEQGAWYDPSDLTSMFQDAAGTTPAVVGQPVGKILDKSGRGNHATQATAAARPTLSARVNLLTYSEQFDNAAWGAPYVTVTPNSTTAPDGTMTADHLIPNAGSNMGYIYSSIPGLLAIGTSYAHTIYAKAGAYPRIGLRLYSGSNYLWHTTVDLLTGAVVTGSTDGFVSSVSVGDGWWKITVSGTANSTGSDLYVEAHNAATIAQQSFTADGTSGIYVWGAQLETGSTATRYQRVTTATDYDTVGFPRKVDYDGIDDLLTASNPDLGTNVTIARATASGASVLTGQTVGANYVDNTDHYGLILINRALTAAETASVTAYLNMKAGL